MSWKHRKSRTEAEDLLRRMDKAIDRLSSRWVTLWKQSMEINRSMDAEKSLATQAGVSLRNQLIECNVRVNITSAKCIWLTRERMRLARLLAKHGRPEAWPQPFRVQFEAQCGLEDAGV